MKMQRTEFSVAEVARQLGVGLQYVYGLIYSGRLEARRVDGKWQVSAEAVEERRQKAQKGLQK